MLVGIEQRWEEVYTSVGACLFSGKGEEKAVVRAVVCSPKSKSQ